MLAYLWPILLVVFSNTLYQICAKSVPGSVSPFASLTVTYLIGTLCSAALFFLTERQAGFFRTLTQLNWAPFVLGLVIVGLEVGWIFAYRAGWQVSMGTIVQSSFLAVALVFVGFFLYKEPLSWNKLLGIAICLVGLVFINLK